MGIIIEAFATKVKHGQITLEEVPEKFREAVKQKLEVV